MNGFERQVQIYGSFFLGLDILYSYRCIFIYHLFVYLFFQSVENQCGWSEKRNQDTLDDLRETIKEKDKTIEVIDKHWWTYMYIFKLFWGPFLKT